MNSTAAVNLGDEIWGKVEKKEGPVSQKSFDISEESVEAALAEAAKNRSKESSTTDRPKTRAKTTCMLQQKCTVPKERIGKHKEQNEQSKKRRNPPAARPKQRSKKHSNKTARTENSFEAVKNRHTQKKTQREKAGTKILHLSTAITITEAFQHRNKPRNGQTSKAKMQQK